MLCDWLSMLISPAHGLLLQRDYNRIISLLRESLAPKIQVYNIYYYYYCVEISLFGFKYLTSIFLHYYFIDL